MVSKPFQYQFRSLRQVCQMLHRGHNHKSKHEKPLVHLDVHLEEKGSLDMLALW